MSHSAANPNSSLSSCDPGQASKLLNQGRLVVIPTETVYGLAGSAASLEAVAGLNGARRLLAPHEPAARPAAWHAPSVSAVLDVVGPLPALHRMLITKLAPGPVTFVLEQGDEAGAASMARLGSVQGACHDASHLYVRIPSHPVAQMILSEAVVPVIAQGIPLSGGGLAVDAREAEGALGSHRIQVDGVVDAGRATLARRSAVIRLTLSGGWGLAEPGIYDEAYIQRQLKRSILFVCTGNTCRSPMAEGIARGLLSASQAEGTVSVSSAGVGAFDGAGFSPEIASAVGKLGFAPPSGQSRALTPAMVSQADEVYVMTRSHRSAVLMMDPSAGGKVRLVDPDGRDVADPIGSTQEIYDQVARDLKRMIERRLKETV